MSCIDNNILLWKEIEKKVIEFYISGEKKNLFEQEEQENEP